MKLLIFTVYDIKAAAYLPPFYLNTSGQALRSFIDTVNDPAHHFNKHPEDYLLYKLGTFDDGDAGFIVLDVPELLAKAIECIENQASVNATQEFMGHPVNAQE